MQAIDPATMAQQLVALERQNMDALLQGQLAKITGQRTALDTLSAKLKEFQNMLKDLNKPASLQAQSATLSEEGFMKVTSDGTAVSGQYSFEITALAQAHQVGMVFDSDAEPLPSSGIFSIEVDGETLEIDLSTFESGATVKDLVSKINSDPDNPGVKASLVRSANGEVNLVLTSEETGVENEMTVNYNGAPGDLLGAAVAAQTEITAAQDAVLQMGGTNPITITSPSNTIENVIDGLTLELTQVTEENKPLVVTVGQDKETVTAALKQFVDTYNALIDEMAAMTASDPKAPGPLASDSGARSLKNLLARAVRDLPDGMSLGALGIKTDSSGKLSFNETDFNDALEKDPELLGEAMLGDGGLLKTMGAALDPYTKRDGVLKGQLEGLAAGEKRINERMAALDRRMESAYNRYLNQFTLMNQMLQSMGAL